MQGGGAFGSAQKTVQSSNSEYCFAIGFLCQKEPAALAPRGRVNGAPVPRPADSCLRAVESDIRHAPDQGVWLWPNWGYSSHMTLFVCLFARVGDGLAKPIAAPIYRRVGRGKQTFTLGNATRAAKALRAAGFDEVSIDVATGIVRGVITTGSTTLPPVRRRDGKG
jgi:hypothetical protein